MKVVFLSTNDILGGAAAVTLRMVEALRAAGCDASMLVARKDTSLPFVMHVNKLSRICAKMSERVEVLCANGFRRKDMWRMSTGRFGVSLHNHPLLRQADIIVLGWVNQGLLSLGELQKILSMGKPVLWWMHDYWCSTGICHSPGGCTRYEQGCGNCPLLGCKASANDLSRTIFGRKLQIYESASRLQFLAVSNHQKELVERSVLSPAMGTVEVLRHAFPAERYYTTPRTMSFDDLGDKKLIVIGAANLCDPLKNITGAVGALNRAVKLRPWIDDECRVVFFGNMADRHILENIDMGATWLGPLSEERLRELYASSAVVLSSSLSETMGATLMEGIAAGAVGASYCSGGPEEIIVEGENGFLAPLGNEEALAEAIGKAVELAMATGTEGRRLRHLSIESRFGASQVAGAFLSMAKRLIQKVC